MSYEVIDKKSFVTRFPNGNKDIDNLDEQTNETYRLLYQAYSNLFRKYLIEKLELKKYDDEMSNSSLNYKKVSEEKMDIYQSFTKKELNYLYIRNNLYIERLSSEQKELLYDWFVQGKEDLNDDNISFIESTYKQVIFEDVSGTGDILSINYGPDNPSYYFPNNSLVIGIRYDEFDLNGMSDDEWDANHDKQIEEINSLIIRFMLEQKDKISVPLYCALYNDYSIKKKQELASGLVSK